MLSAMENKRNYGTWSLELPCTQNFSIIVSSGISRSPGVSIPCTPCILVMGDQRFKIDVDQEIVNGHISSPIVALAYAFALFYVLNIKYPKEMSLTLEFIQRVFLGINPERGSKAEMKGEKAATHSTKTAQVPD